MKYDLLIVYADGLKVVINHVDKYGHTEQGAMFFFEKNLIRSFIPSNNVLFFGLEGHLKGAEFYNE